MYMELASIDRIEISAVGRSYTGSQGRTDSSQYLKRRDLTRQTEISPDVREGIRSSAGIRVPIMESISEDNSQSDFRSTLSGIVMCAWHRMEQAGFLLLDDLPGSIEW